MPKMMQMVITMETMMSSRMRTDVSAVVSHPSGDERFFHDIYCTASKTAKHYLGQK